jgi:aldose 1-epimerase
MLVLKQDTAELGLLPALGGAISHFSVGGTQILRQSPNQVDNVLDTAHFPMLPLTHRLPGNAFEFDGKQVSLTANTTFSKDFIHGHGWLNAWQVEKTSETSATLRYEHTNGEWPWSYTARQMFELSSDAMSLEIKLTNTTQSSMPVCMGFHPFFSKDANTKVEAKCAGYWDANADLAPVKQVSGKYDRLVNAGRHIDELSGMDHTLYGYEGDVHLSSANPKTVTQISVSENCRNLHIYVPENENYCALEPVMGRGNAFGVLPREYVVLQPEDSVSVHMTIRQLGTRKV